MGWIRRQRWARCIARGSSRLWGQNYSAVVSKVVNLFSPTTGVGSHLVNHPTEDFYERNHAGQAQVGALDPPVVSSTGEIRVPKKEANEGPTLRSGED